MAVSVFKRGSKGPYVFKIQQILNARAGYATSFFGNGTSILPPLEEDGNYGKLTADRVKEFQMVNPPLKIDGKVGPNTYAKLTGQFWASEQAKGASEAAPVAAAAAAPKSRGHLYVHAHDAPGKGNTGSNHDAKMCHHVMVPNGSARDDAMLDLIKSEIEDENLGIVDVVLNSHGASGGQVCFGGATFSLGDKAEKFFRDIKPALVGNGIIYTFACGFATATYASGKYGADDVWLVEPREIREGIGTKQMKKIARFTGRRVRAGFGMQFGDMSGFTTPWAEVTPNGDVSFHIKGRELTTGEWIGQKKAETGAFLSLLIGGQFL